MMHWNPGYVTYHIKDSAGGLTLLRIIVKRFEMKFLGAFFKYAAELE